MDREQALDVVTRLQDNGDGGYTMYVYNNTDEMLEAHPMAEEFKDGKFVSKQLTEEERAIIVNEEDPYNNGYIGADTIHVCIDDEGKASLAKPIQLSAGQ